ncbi:MAG: hypothetical protein AAF320_03615 [Myxococcota bacterium]
MRHNKKNLYFLHIILMGSLLSAGCGDSSSSADNLEAALASLITSGNCVDQEPVQLSEENPEYEKEGLALSLDHSNLSQKSIVFTPSICKVPQNRIKLNGKEFPTSHILYLTNVNPSSPNMQLFFSVKSVAGVEKIIRYETNSKALSAGSIEQNDSKGRMLGSAGTIPAKNIALLASSSSLLEEISDGITVSELAARGGIASVIVKTLCQSLFTALTLDMALNDTDFLLPFGLNTDPNNICDLIDQVKTPKKCKDFKKSKNIFEKTMGSICVFGTGSFMKSFICSFASSLSEEEILPFIGLEGCEKGDSATFCMFNNQEMVCSLISSLI